MRRNLLWSILIIASVVSCQQFKQGERLYTLYCATCHMDDGSGLVKLIPPLDSADFLLTNSESVPCIIKYGTDGGNMVNGIMYNEPMQAFPELNDVEISNIINYIHTSWQNDLPLTSPSEVKQLLESCE